MTLSARNRIQGEITAVETDGVSALVTVAIADDETVTAVITRRSAEELDLTAGDSVETVVKATEVMIDAGE